MKVLKRFITTVNASVERTVASMENHDAIVVASLRDSQTAVAKARVRLARVEKEEKSLNNRAQELTTEIQLWEQRATSVAATDRAKALRCLQSRKMAEQNLAHTQQRIAEQGTLIRQVRQSVETMQKRVEDVTQQRNHMRARESAAEAVRIVSAADNAMPVHLEESLSRWEESIEEAELINQFTVGSPPIQDSLADEFVAAETQEELEHELDALLSDQAENAKEDTHHE